MSFKAFLMQGWIPEVRGVSRLGFLCQVTETKQAKYGLDIKITSKNAIISHIWTAVQLEDPLTKSSWQVFKGIQLSVRSNLCDHGRI